MWRGRAKAERAAADAAERLLAAGGLLRRVPVTDDGRAVFRTDQGVNDAPYRERWAHDKVVRSTHGVNCTGSCSWQVFVKDGLITWETQATDYPSVGPDRPEYEPRGCPRGASFSWYTYSPTRVRYPYARGVLLEMYRAARARLGDPVAAWAQVTGDPQQRLRYQRARGKGGLVRVGWDEALEIAAAAHVHTLREHGPDRMNLDTCIGCHTCSVTCKQTWTNRTGTEYVWFDNVGTRPGPARTADRLLARTGPPPVETVGPAPFPGSGPRGVRR
ncbi:molybdopterin-dependent oxidoreductase [Streptomyces sp. NPDC059788]|uniref:molybdopterin-dependent oxidoreductase n=1 Tax=Streptomyces sp. NPDC059788 TaxID=3346948 RepID=UPI003664025B